MKVAYAAGFAGVLATIAFPRLAVRFGLADAARFSLRFVFAPSLSWLLLALSHATIGFPNGWSAFLLWLALSMTLLVTGPRLLLGRLGQSWASLFTPALPATHGSARFGGARDAAAAGHLAPAAPADAFVLGELPGGRRGADRRFWQDGHILRPAPAKGIGAVIPNPGSAFVQPRIFPIRCRVLSGTAPHQRCIGAYDPPAYVAALSLVWRRPGVSLSPSKG